VNGISVGPDNGGKTAAGVFSSSSGRVLPALVFLFFGSGSAALIYEIVWFQLLQLVIGSSAVSLAVLLGTFMGGMCLGSLVLPRFISPRRHPLRVYAFLELSLGILGILVLFAIPLVSRIYSAHVGPGFAGMCLRALVTAACLIPPTMLMGATLPAIARWIETTPQGVSWLGFFYGGNIAGAVMGCLLAGFYLLRVHDMTIATYVAAAINGLVALTGFILAVVVHPVTTAAPARAQVRRPPGQWAVYVVIALSGLAALGAEVVWTRLLSLIFGGTVYTFSIILAVFLLGLGLGSGGGSLWARRFSPRAALCGCQVAQAAAIAWTGWIIARSLPYWPINPSLSGSPWIMFQLDFVRCLWAILPATLLWGASFPLALAAAASPGQDPGRLVGGVYAANTIGAIIGAIGFSVGFIPAFGTQQSQRLLIGISVLAGFLLWFSRLRPFRLGSSLDAASASSTPFEMKAMVWLVLLGTAALLAWSVPKVPPRVVAYGRFLPTRTDLEDILYVGEGMNSSVAVSERWDTGARNFHVSGKVEASSEPQDMRLQRMLGHLPALVHPKPQSVLVVGCGAGVTAGSFVLHPSVERIVICEIEPLIPRVVAQYFDVENYHVLKDPRVQVIYDDARHYLLTTPERFDIITSDPIHPWVKGAATLYTLEYFELVKRHLNPGGVVSQWVPLYESTAEVVKSELATFFAAFPEGTVWSNESEGLGYDVVLLGQAEATRIQVDEMQQRLNLTNYLSVTLSLDEVNIRSAVDLLASYAGRGPDLRPWLKTARLNRDRNLQLQYLAGLGLNANTSHGIYLELLKYRQYPEELFVASNQRGVALRKALGLPPSK
jgi:spermidine synthase